jgi:predicted phage terminase large subunit-like protein
MTDLFDSLGAAPLGGDPSLLADLIACDRETGLHGSFYDFVKLVWPEVYGSSPFVDNWHYGLLCEHYEACYRGEIEELLVNLPPGGGKSSLTCVLFPSWVWLKSPERSIITGAYGQKLVRRDAEASHKLMAGKWWQQRWGDRFSMPSVPAIELLKNDRGGFRLGTTPGGEATGWHANYQILDDPVKPEECTPIGLDNAKRWITGTLDSRWRRPPQVNSRICIMQRLHCDDPSALFLERGAVHLMLPAEFNPTRKCVTAWGQDPRTTPKEVLDPVRMPPKFLAKMRKHLGPMAAAAQLDQDPVPEGGAVFASDQVQFWSIMPPGFDQVILSADCAFKDDATSDFVAIQVWGRSGAHFYLLDQTHGHLNFAGTKKGIIDLALRWPAATVKLVEDKANGTAVAEELGRVFPGIVAVDPKGGKFSRANACVGLFQAGNVYLPDPKMPGYEWVESLYLPELLRFPRAKNDDQVDATTQALIYLQEHTSYLAAAMTEVRKWLGYVDLG